MKLSETYSLSKIIFQHVWQKTKEEENRHAMLGIKLMNVSELAL